MNYSKEEQGKNKLIKLEAIRGFAAVYVVMHHTIHSLIIRGLDFSWLFRFGQEAVILFFIISGFVIEHSYSHSNDKSFKAYFSKRFLRIYTPLLCVFVLHGLIIFYKQGFLRFDFGVLVGNLLMLQDISALKPNVVVDPFLDNTPLWSLSYEWWFYMIYFFIKKEFKEKDTLVVFRLGIISSITYVLYPSFINRILMYLIIWWMGVAIARVYSRGKLIQASDLKKELIILLLVCFILVFNFFFRGGNLVLFGVSPFLELRHFVFAFMVILLALLWQYYTWVGFSIIFGGFSIFAPISYGIYISHYFLISEATYLNFIPSYFQRYLAYGGICLVFSYLIERIIFPYIKTIFYSSRKQRSRIK